MHWSWAKGPIKGELDLENEHLILDNYKVLVKQNLDEDKVVKILNRSFGKAKVQRALKGFQLYFILNYFLCAQSIFSSKRKFLSNHAHL